VWLASGFGGHGLNTTAMAGNIIARAIVEGDQTWRQFTPFELVWAGGVFGRAAAQLRVWIKRLRAAVDERRAKARELAHRQARDAALAAKAERQSTSARQTTQPPQQPSAAADSIIPAPVGADAMVEPEPTPQPQNPPPPSAKGKRRRQGAKA
jgi:gamma-glutamylputrescine oxidase